MFDLSSLSPLASALLIFGLRVLDGWWREGFNGSNGWAIGDDREYANDEEQDAAEAGSLYTTLEKEILPLYYENRSPEDMPLEWIGRMKQSIRTLAPLFGTRRMLKEYAQDMYLAAMNAESVNPKSQ